ncbi:hypothetical protein [Polaromonas naphthalenivorans]|uniref:Uncharacterized protein n=1 Tax=Polaromonas naphthalenivorans (strain CJ2) TaxID=365044 RepID=A1VWD6_POLNA|nr:hypothetical protein [Polaromonas naphthalenivorans]ABM39964.1 hypothetical protein Pnap_4900 [Polaromonas naphthalenivorans CJ2]
MTTPNPRDPDDLEPDVTDEMDERLVHRKLADILTVSPAEAKAWANSERIELASLIRSFKPRAGQSSTRNWLSTAMVSLPLDHVTLDVEFSMRAPATATLKYQTAAGTDADDVFTHIHAQNRANVCQDLFEELTRKQQLTYAPLVKWGKLRTADAKRHERLEDVQIADSINVLEDQFEKRYLTYEREARAEHNFSVDQPTPLRLVRFFAEEARDDVLVTVKRWVSTAGSGDNIVLRTLCNIAANRALLESAKAGTLAQEGASAIIALLNAINQVGIFEAPEVSNDTDIKNLLLQWFGSDGPLATAGNSKRGLTPREVEAAIRQAAQAQREYVYLRPASDDPLAETAFKTPNDRLMFALALIADRQMNQRVDKEQKGEGTPKYVVFDPKAEELGVHALTMVMRQYGQIAFSNAAWELRADRVKDYVDALSYKRARRQEMVFKVFKRMEVDKLLTVHNTLMQHVPELRNA